MARRPQGNPQPAQGPLVPQFALIRNPPFQRHVLAPNIRSFNCAEPGTTSILVLETAEGNAPC
eukprot:15430885-Alexandrium_andersonii.AAC.1